MLPRTSLQHPDPVDTTGHTCPIASNIAANLGEIGAKKLQMFGI